MLYNPNWQRTLTLLNLIAWLETKPAHQQYIRHDPHRCLLSEFFGHKAPVRIPKPFCSIILTGPFWRRQTYGEALSRARDVHSKITP